MKNKAFVLGLAVLVYTFVLKGLGSYLVVILPWSLANLASLLASAATAMKVASRLGGDAEPPRALSNALLVSAGICTAFILWGMVGRGYPGIYLGRANIWALAITVALSVRFMSPRAMVFIGVTAFCMQFYLINFAAAFLSGLAHWVDWCARLAVAVAIAHALTKGEMSPASRVKNVNVLWFFGAAGALTQFIEGDIPYLFSYHAAEWLIWLAFLASFGWLVVNIDSGDRSGTETGMGTRVMAFIGMFATISMGFHLMEIIIDRLAYSTGMLANWIPLLVSLAVTWLWMRWTKLGERIPEDGPGRGLLKWGVVVYIVGMIAGGGIFGASGGGTSLASLLPALAAFAIVALPLLGVAQILVGFGLLRVVFALGTSPGWAADRASSTLAKAP